MREEVYVQAPGVSTPQRRSGEQRGCQSSTTPSRGSLERRIMLFSRGGHILTQVRDKMERDKMEIPVYRSLAADNVRLPMMGARALVDMLIVQKVGDVGSFQQKLAALERKGIVGSQGRDVLSAALDIGNAAAHRGHAVTESKNSAIRIHRRVYIVWGR
jgi:hypothetical protein